jgi:type IV secretion system protein VirB8
MTVVKSDGLKAYFETARSFDQDRVLSAERSRRVAWFVASGACGLAACAVLAVAAMSPLKTVEPFMVKVDSATGIVETVSALNATTGNYEDPVTKYFAARYVRAREGFSATESEINYKVAGLLSAPEEQARFTALYRGGNPDSPQNVLRNATAKIAIKSISLLNKNVVAVRYLRTVTRGEEVRTTHWVATATFSYLATPMLEADRLINPLGFAVSDYRSDPEAVQ